MNEFKEWAITINIFTTASGLLLSFGGLYLIIKSIVLVSAIRRNDSELVHELKAKNPPFFYLALGLALFISGIIVFFWN